MLLNLFLPVTVTAVGLFLLCRLKFFFIFHPIRTLKEFLFALKDRDAGRSLCLALAGTLGVGNIFGVAAGIMIGGEGSLFWLFLSSLFSAVIKYAEVVLAFDGEEKGGMAGIILRTLRGGRVLSVIYAGLTVMLSLSMGAVMQSVAVYDVAIETIGIMPPISAVFLVLLLFPSLIGGVKKIENITDKVIPLTTIIYIIMCFCVIFLNFSEFGSMIFRIFSSAFSFKSFAGGSFALAIKEGFSRGVLSNEAGVGTSVLAHVRAKERTPHIAGLFGMCEVFFDTTVLCSLTGIVILLSVDDISAYKTPMSLVFAAFKSSLGGFGGLLLPLIFCFAYATIICWFYYGVSYCELYFGRLSKCYLSIFLLCISLSYLLPQSVIIYVTDTVLFFMSCLTLIAIVKKSDRISLLSKKRS